MTKPSVATAPVMRSLPVGARSSRRRKARAVVIVTLYDPRKLATLRTAMALGASLSVSFDGYRLTIQAAEGRDDS